MIKRHAIGAAAVLLGFSLAPSAGATDWELTLTPYIWAAGIDGDIQARGQDVNVNASFSDILDNLDMAGAAMLEFNRGRWVNFIQADYIAIDTGDVDTRIGGVDADLESDTTLATFASGYRFRTGERSTLDLMAGIRYARVDTGLSIQGVGNIDTDSEIYDAIVVLRPRLNIGGDWYFSPTLSWGGGDSEKTYELSPQFMYDGCGVEIRFGYRNLNYDFDKDRAQMDISFRGPLIGVGFRF